MHIVALMNMKNVQIKDVFHAVVVINYKRTKSTIIFVT